MNKLFSFSAMTEKLLLLTKRFPVAILLVVTLTVLILVGVNGDFGDIPYQFWFFFTVGTFISVAVTLFAEDYFTHFKTYGVSLLVVLLWGVFCYFLPEQYSEIQMGKGIEIYVLSFAAFFTIFFISFCKKNTDRAFWNFAVQTLSQLLLACFFGLIFYAGLSLALLAVDSLFDISVSGKVYMNLAVICFSLFSPIYFLANIPHQAEKYTEEIYYSKSQKILALYILTPILAIYAIILYLYLFKIIIAWELPNGWVSWLVSALALGGLLVISFLYPVRQHENNKVAHFISRWFGLLILPLLVLMSVGIFRRIGDYGITINRGYMLLLNLWFYGIYIYLFFTQSRHIKWILISLVVIAVLTSNSECGVSSITEKSLTKEMEAVLNKPVSADEARMLFSGMTQPEKDRIKSTLEYLHSNFGKESVQPFFTDTVSNYSWNLFSELGLQDILTENHQSISYHSESEKTWQIEPYTHFTRLNYYSYERENEPNNSFDKKTMILNVLIDNRTLSIPLREIVLDYLATDEKLRKESEFSVRDEKYTLLISDFYGDYYPQNDSVYINSINGYLFYE